MVGGPTARIFQVMLLGAVISLIWGNKMMPLIHEPATNDLNVIKKLIESSEVVPVIDSCYPLSEVAEAFQYFGEGDMQGKVIITMQHNHTA